MAVMMAGEEHDIGFKLYLRAASKLEKFVNSFEEHFTWLQEILAEAKNTFSNSEIQLLPKTPSVIKRKQRRPKNVIVEEEDEPRRKSSRRVKRSKKSMEDCESSSTNQGATSVVPTSARVTRSSRSTRSTRNNPLPVSSKAGGSGSPQPNIPKSSLFSADKNKSKTAASSPNQQITKPSPKAIPGFTTLSVKDKASAYEEYVTQSPGGVAVNVPSDDSASPRRRNAVCKVLDRLRQSNSPRRSKSPLSGSKTTGNVHPSDRSTITKSQAVEGSPKPGPQTLKGNEQSKARRSSTRVVSMPLGVRKLSKRRSSMLRQKVSLAASTKNSSSIRRTPSKCRKPTPAPTTFVGTTEDEQTDCSDKTEEKLPSTDPGCETEDQPEPMQVQDVSDTTAVSDSSGSSRATRSKVPESKAPPQPLLGTDEEATAKKGSATEDGGSQGDAEDECDSPCPKAPVPAPRTTRSKLRLNKPALKLPVTSSDEDGSPARQASSFRPVAPPSTLAPCRSTRSKVRQWKNHEVESPSYTHLKRVRDASKLDFNPVSQADEVTWLRSRANVQVDEASPPKKRCTDVCGVGENNEEGSGTPVSEDTEGAVDKTPSPKCPRNKIIHGGSNPSQSFANNLKKTVNTPGNLCSTLTSFIKRHTPKKGTVQINMERDLQKRKELDAKNKEMESRLNKRQELLQQRAEDQRRRRIERQELVAKRRQEQQQREMSVKKETLQKFVEKKDLQTRIHEEKQREEREKQKLREKKMMEAELRRKQEIEARQQKLLEAEAEARKQEEFQQRKREFEEAERQRRIAEHRRLEEERRIEAEQERQREIKKLKREQEQRERDLAGQKRLKEETLKRERAERERLAREAQEERERQRMEELDRIRERERERLQALYASKKEEEKKSKEEERKLHEAIHKHNQALHSNTSVLNSTTKLKENLNSTITKETPSLNTTITKETPSLKTTITKETSTVNTESYNMTPTQKKKKVRNHNNENYDISEMNSEDSTDDDEAPRKVVPKWALGANLKAALIHQYYHPPNLDEIFDTIEYSDLDLNVVFKTKRPRFNKRTSSACWDSPILKPSGAMP